jgi:hypothetical protein
MFSRQLENMMPLGIVVEFDFLAEYADSTVWERLSESCTFMGGRIGMFRIYVRLLVINIIFLHCV